jgi:hypothetical protein
MRNDYSVKMMAAMSFSQKVLKVLLEMAICRSV